MPTSSGGTPPDPGGHTALALDDPRFVPLSRHPLSKVEEPPDAMQDCLFPVLVFTTYYFDPNAATIIKLHKLELWPGYVTSKEKIMLCQEISHKVLHTDAIVDQTRGALTPLPSQGGQSFHSDIEEALLGAAIINWYYYQTYWII